MKPISECLIYVLTLHQAKFIFMQEIKSLKFLKSLIYLKLISSLFPQKRYLRW